MTYWLFDGSDVVGPFTVQQLLARGGFGSGSLVCPEKHSNEETYWKAASFYAEFGFAQTEQDTLSAADLALTQEPPNRAYEQEMLDTLVGPNAPLATSDELESAPAESAPLEMPSNKAFKPSPIEDYFNNIKGEDLGNILGMPDPNENSDMSLQRALETQFDDFPNPQTARAHGPLENDPFDEFTAPELADVDSVAVSNKTPASVLEQPTEQTLAQRISFSEQQSAQQHQKIKQEKEAAVVLKQETAAPYVPGVLNNKTEPPISTRKTSDKAPQKMQAKSSVSRFLSPGNPLSIPPEKVADFNKETPGNHPVPLLAEEQTETLCMEETGERAELNLAAEGVSLRVSKTDPALKQKSNKQTFVSESTSKASSAKKAPKQHKKQVDGPVLNALANEAGEMEISEAEAVFRQSEANALCAAQETVLSEKDPAQHMPLLPTEQAAQPLETLADARGKEVQELVKMEEESDPAAQTVRDILQGQLKIAEKTEVKEPIKEVPVDPRGKHKEAQVDVSPVLEEFESERVVRRSRRKPAGVLALVVAVFVVIGAFYLNRSMPEEQGAQAAPGASSRPAVLASEKKMPALPKTAMPIPSRPEAAKPLSASRGGTASLPRQTSEPAPLSNSDRALSIAQNYYLPAVNDTIGGYFDKIYKDKPAEGYLTAWSAEPLHKEVYMVKYRVTKTRKEPIVYIFQVDAGKEKVVGALNNITLDLVGKIK